MLSNFRKNIGLFVVLVLSLVPVVIWYLLKPYNVFGVNIMTGLGEIFALVGMALFSLTMFISARIKSMEKYFGSLGRSYKIHHTLGGIAFILLLFHPLFLAGSYLLVSLRSAALFLLPGSDVVMNLGFISLYGMAAIMILTLFVKLPYHIKKNMHKIFGAVFIIGALHSFLVASDITRNPVLFYYMFGLFILGIFTVFYRTLFNRFFVKRFKYTVKDVKDMGDNIIEIEMGPCGKTISYKPGQYIFISFHQKDFSSETHPFSISSSPYDKNLKIVVKMLGDYTSKIKDLKAGTMAKVEGPFGDFSYQNAGENQIWIAGGIGITPFLSMARSFGRDMPNVHLFYCTSCESEAVYIDELKKIASKHDNFKLITWHSKDKGRLSGELIHKEHGLKNKDILICGPKVMTDALKDQFLKLGVSKSHIISEEFGLL